MTDRKPDTRIINRGRGHSYVLDGQKVQGVTTIISDGVPKGALVNWAARTAAEYAVDHWDELERLPVSERLDLIRRAPDAARTAGGVRGDEVHRLVHRWLLGETITVPDDRRGYVDAGLRFMDEWDVQELAVEAACFWRGSDDVGRPRPYGGRFDLLGALLADAGRVWLLDWKTTLKGVFSDTALQLAAYRYSAFYVLEGEVDEDGRAIEHPMPPVDRVGVVLLRDDGSYDLVPLEGDWEALAVFTAAQEVAAFTKSANDDWIGAALMPPEKEAA